MKKTKIVCTLGPACCSEEVLEQMCKNGMDAARLNFSHMEHSFHEQNISTLKSIRERLCMPLPIILDTKGPEIRVGSFDGGSALLETGKEFILSAEDITGNSTVASVSFKQLAGFVKKDDRILLDDGKIELSVEKCKGENVVCRILAGGRLGNRRGVNLPDVEIDMPFLSAADRQDLLFGIEHGVDFIAASFVKSAGDVKAMREFLDENGGESIKIISKIESAFALKNFDEILAVSDGIMIARGDMGVETPYERLPGIQKRLLKQCYSKAKPVITATEMLESMIREDRPTRAEISDVAGAVFDGTSAVMLSGETAIGRHPALTVRVMSSICRQAEKDMRSMRTGIPCISCKDVTGAVCDSVCRAAEAIDAAAICAVTANGRTAREIAARRPLSPVVAVTLSPSVYRQLGLTWGVAPYLSLGAAGTAELESEARALLLPYAPDSGGTAVFAFGTPSGRQGKTDTMKIINL